MSAARSIITRSGINSPTGKSAEQRVYQIALAGNPNSGKTTLFNALTGLRYKVGNYPGVTVERKQGKLQLDDTSEVEILDLPGIYSLSGYALDEQIATKALFGEVEGEIPPDVIVAVIDATNLERNLYLTTQLIDLGIPLVVALSMSDMADKQGITVQKELLAKALDVPVVAVVGTKGYGLEALKREMQDLLYSKKASKEQFRWLPSDSAYRKSAEDIGKLEQKGRSGASQQSPLLRGSFLLSESATSTAKQVTERVRTTREELLSQKIDCLSFEATSRYRWINSLVKKCVSLQNTKHQDLFDKLDSIITHKLWGSLIFAALMAFMFQAIFLWASIPMDFIDRSFSEIGAWVTQHLPEGALRSLVANGIIAGVGSVIVFIPQIAILFFFLGLLEDSGYLSRAAFMMDRLMRPFGLQGRSFIPLLSSFACAIPGILSTRTIPSFSDRLKTILVAPLMSCSARLPVYTLLIAAFIPRHEYFGFVSLQGLVLLGMYLLGIIGAAFIAFLLTQVLLKGEGTIFVMEMPPFRWPTLKMVLREVLDRVMIFLKNAGTIILACSIVLWFLAAYPKGDVRESYAGQIGTWMEPAIKPLGYNWEIGVAILASFAAREVFVSSLATVYNLQHGKDDSTSLIQTLKKKNENGTFSLATALSLMVFYVFACQCISTLAVCKRETGSWKWVGFMFGYMTALAYGGSFVAYQLGKAVF